MGIVTTTAAILGAAAAVAGLMRLALAPIRKDVRSTAERMSRIERRQMAAHEQAGGLLLALSGVLPHIASKEGDDAGRSFDEFRYALGRMLARAIGVEAEMGNPLTKEELARLERYREVLQDRLLDEQEASDFEALVRKMADHHPDEPDFAVLLGMALLVVGLALFASGGKKPDPGSVGSAAGAHGPAGP